MTATDTDLDIVSYSLDVADSELRRLTAFLSAEECLRAAQFRFRRSRRRFVVGRGRLREILGQRTCRDPHSLRFAYGPNGKPELADSSVRFNLSHCEGVALLAVTCGRDVGVDVERLRPVADLELVAERFFSSLEVRALRALPTAKRDAAFLRCWTRKEAYVKAVGGGLSMGLRDFAVSLHDGEPAGIVWAAEPSEARRWSVSDLSTYVPRHLAALVVPVPPEIDLPATPVRECP